MKTIFLSIAMLFISQFSFSQVDIGVSKVGIRVTVPQQALDVGGKVKIGNDGTTPTEGTLRYGATGDFQGYTANGWQSFTEKSNGPLPSAAIPVFGFINLIAPNSNSNLTFRDWDENTYTNPPVNKMFIVTGIYPAPNAAATPNNFYALSLSVVNTSGGTNPVGTNLRISGYDNVSQSFSGDQSPLMVIKVNQALNVFSYGSSEIVMSISIRGFLVDDISY